MKLNYKPLLLLKVVCLSLFPGFQAIAQQPTVVVDSSLLERINTLEKQVAYKKPGDEHFMVAGLLTLGFAANKTTTTFDGIKDVSKTNSLGDIDHYEFS